MRTDTLNAPHATSGDPPTLLVTSGVARLDPERLARFSAAGFNLVYDYELSGVQDPRRVSDALSGVWGVLAGTELYNREVLRSAPSLRAIARCGVGFDAIDVAAATEQGVSVITTPGTNDESVAEFAVSAILTSTVLRAGDPVPLSGETVAVIGLGAIGMAVARRLDGFGCRILGVDPAADLDACHRLGVEVTSLRSAISRAGVVTIHAPLHDGTRGMIGPAELALMPPDAVLVNTGRGGIVDEPALVAALVARRIRGAAIDVFAEEPLPASHPLRDAPSTLLSGHVAGVTLGSVRAMLDRALDGLVDVLAQRSTVRGAVNGPPIVGQAVQAGAKGVV